MLRIIAKKSDAQPKVHLFNSAAPFFLVLLFFSYLPFSQDAYDAPKLAALFVLLPIGFLLHLIDKKKIECHPYIGAFFVSAVAAVIAGFFAQAFYPAFFGTFVRRTGSLLILLAGLLMVYFFQHRRSAAVETAVVLSASILAVLSVMQAFLRPEAFEGRAFLLFGNPVFLGGVLALSAAAVFGYEVNPYLKAAALVLTGAGIAVTGTRVALAAYVISLLVAALSFRKFRPWIITGLVAAAVIFAVLFGSRFFTLPDDAASRVELYRLAAEKSAEKPLTGFGFNQFENAIRQSDYAVELVNSDSQIPDTSHSFLLDLFMSAGVIAGLFYLAFLGGLIIINPVFGTAALVLSLFMPFSSSLLLVMAALSGLAHREAGCVFVLERLPRSVKIAGVLLVSLLIALGIYSAYRVLGADYYYSKAVDATHSGEIVRAENAYTAASSLAPHDKFILQQMSIFLAQKVSFTGRPEDFTRALEIARKAIEADPYDEINHLIAGRIYTYLGDTGKPENYEKAINEFKVCVYLSPYDAVAWYELGIAYAGTGNLEEAEKSWEKAIELKKDFVDAYFSLGYAREQQEDYEGARKYYEAALEYADQSEIPAIREALNRLDSLQNR